MNMEKHLENSIYNLLYVYIRHLVNKKRLSKVEAYYMATNIELIISSVGRKLSKTFFDEYGIYIKGNDLYSEDDMTPEEKYKRKIVKRKTNEKENKKTKAFFIEDIF